MHLVLLNLIISLCTHIDFWFLKLVVIQFSIYVLYIWAEKSSMPVAEQCAWALGNVAGECEELRNILLAQGALLSLARMMQSNKSSTARTAAWALSNLIKVENFSSLERLHLLLCWFFCIIIFYDNNYSWIFLPPCEYVINCSSFRNNTICWYWLSALFSYQIYYAFLIDSKIFSKTRKE